MTLQSTHQSGHYSELTSIPANPERRSRLFTQVRRYSGILGPSSRTPTPARHPRVTPILPSLPSESQQSEDGADRSQAQTERQPAEPVAFTDPATIASNEVQFINAVLELGDIIAASHPTKLQKIKEPDTFDGTDSSKLDEWITQVTLYFTANPSVFESDEDKVIFAMSYLCGQALAWFQPDLLGGLSEDEPEPAWASDFVAFIHKLVVNLSPHDPVGDAESKLELLQMQDSEHITEFLVKFNLKAGRTGWGDAALWYYFYKSLPDRIKDGMSKDGKAPTLALMKQQAQEYDARHWERIEELAQEAVDFHFEDSSSSDDDSDSESDYHSAASSISAHSSRSSSPLPSTSTSQWYSHLLGPDGKLTAEEHARRIAEDLCRYCGDNKHTAADCPKLQAARFNSMTEDEH
jgi:hypothetical protein